MDSFWLWDAKIPVILCVVKYFDAEQAAPVVDVNDPMFMPEKLILVSILLRVVKTTLILWLILVVARVNLL